MSTDLATLSNPSALAPRGGRPRIMAEVLKEEGEQRKLLGQYIAQHMIEGVDYGVIPGTERKDRPGNKTLLKPGAEKLTDLFRCVPEFDLVERVEDWDRPLIHYLFRCRIVSRDTGAVVAEGFGSCNSRESKYRYRGGERACPECGKAAIIKGKAEYGGGFLCFAKKGGCGAKFGDHDAAITGQAVGKVENPDVADAANTILKMAKKRAQVDAVISLARCSDMFTQDVEDFQEDGPAPAPTDARPAPKANPTPPPASAAGPSKAEFSALMAAKGWNWSKALKTIDHTQGTNFHGEQFTFEQVPGAIIADFAAWLQQQPDKPAQPSPPPSQAATAPLAQQVIAAIAEATSMEELNATAELLADAKGLSGDDLKALRMAWQAKKQKLHPAAAAA